MPEPRYAIIVQAKRRGYPWYSKYTRYVIWPQLYNSRSEAMAWMEIVVGAFFQEVNTFLSPSDYKLSASVENALGFIVKEKQRHACNADA